jgi:alanyl-tRNA synthetase
VLTHEVSAEGLGQFDLRREAARRDKYRIVEVENTDAAACGGVHVKRTGEVGLIACVGQEKIRGHVRLLWAIGDRAYRDYAQRIALTTEIGALLSAPADEAVEAVEALQGRAQDLAARLERAEEARALGMAEALLERAATFGGVRLITHLLSEPADFTKRVLSALAGAPDCLAVLANRGGERAQIAACVSEDLGVDLASLISPLLATVEGKGGGKGRIWQGVAGDPGKLDAFLAAAGRSAQGVLSEGSAPTAQR